MLIMGQGTDEYILVMFCNTVLSVSHNMLTNELLGGGLCSPSTFLVKGYV